MSSSQLLHLLLLLLPLQCCCNCTKFISFILLLVSALLSKHLDYLKQQQQQQQQQEEEKQHNQYTKNTSNKTIGSNNDNNIFIEEARKITKNNNNNKNNQGRIIYYSVNCHNNHIAENTNFITEIVQSKIYKNYNNKQKITSEDIITPVVQQVVVLAETEFAIAPFRQRGVTTRTLAVENNIRSNCARWVNRQRYQNQSHGSNESDNNRCNYIVQNVRRNNNQAEINCNYNNNYKVFCQQHDKTTTNNSVDIILPNSCSFSRLLSYQDKSSGSSLECKTHNQKSFNKTIQINNNNNNTSTPVVHHNRRFSIFSKNIFALAHFVSPIAVLTF